MSDLTPMKERILDWLFEGHTGISSKAMARALLGKNQNPDWPDCHPHDPDDLQRCVGFMKAVPEARTHMDAFAAINPVWAALVAQWGTLEAMLEEEAPTGRAPRTYERMKALIKEGRRQQAQTDEPAMG